MYKTVYSLMISLLCVAFLFSACEGCKREEPAQTTTYQSLSAYIASDRFEEYVKDFTSDSFDMFYTVENDMTLVISVKYSVSLTDDQKAQMAFSFLAREDDIKASFEDLKEEISKNCVNAEYKISERLVDEQGNVFAEISG